MDANEMIPIIRRRTEGELTQPVDEGGVKLRELRDTLMQIHTRAGPFADPKQRMAKVLGIADELTTGDPTLASPEQRDDDRKRLALFSIGLLHLAAEEPHAATQEAMMQQITKLFRVPKRGDVPPAPETERRKVDALLAQLTGMDVKDDVPDPAANLADMEGGALLRAAARAAEADMSQKARHAVVAALANSEEPMLFHFFARLIIKSKDRKLKRFAVRGLERIIKSGQLPLATDDDQQADSPAKAGAAAP